jgi:hypothetical protein
MLYICKLSNKLDLNQAIRVSHTRLGQWMEAKLSDEFECRMGEFLGAKLDELIVIKLGEGRGGKAKFGEGNLI